MNVAKVVILMVNVVAAASKSQWRSALRER